MTGPRLAGTHARATAKRLLLRAAITLFGIVAAGVAAGLAWGFDSWRFYLVELIAVGLMFALDRVSLPVIDRWVQGYEGERHVGRILEGLREFGWHVLHDVDLGRGNVDHILVGPPGIITVETKSHAGKIYAPGIDEKMLKQSYAQAKRVGELFGEKAEPLLVFSRAYVYPKMVSRQRGVVVLPARALPAHLARRKAVLSEQEVRAVYERLAAQLEPAAAT